MDRGSLRRLDDRAEAWWRRREPSRAKGRGFFASVGRALVWAAVSSALSAATAAAITAIISAGLGRASTDPVDAASGVGFVLGGLVGFIAAFILRRAQPGQRVAAALRPLMPRAHPDKAARRRAWTREHPVQASTTLGGAWALFAWGLSAATDSSARSPSDLLVWLAFGVLGLGPLTTWLVLRRDR